ncbi:hypothetical protein BGP78_01470 [Pseudoalteromonas sp. MSK9-3]|uniref:hypothetical protein n=1 Tax=Pseudoalteromonas sp. MSK9-3 TaxID=1897633 RepID=UPI000E6C9CED|nr:hypothetical protein [Pseudoalteromonas sp. MSK9-3]RJE76944.1 hypothetical protein BGP78_01470 [Pseudoalteromonas sp. MSK9-3]
MDNQAQQLTNAVPNNLGQDLAQLRQQGIARIQQFAPSTWTDHNRFDPGITLLEALVYVLSDLSYKLDYPVAQLLTQAQAGGSTKFYEPEQVLFSHCVTESDYRRLILDLQDVKNVHVNIRQLADSNTIAVDFNVLLYVEDDGKKAAVTEQINQAFARGRCVNHVLGDIVFYEISKINVGMTLALRDVDALVPLLIEIYTLIGREISPDVTKYTAQQLVNKGLRVGDIYQGPRLERGFVLDEELNKSAYSVRLFSSNILSTLHEHKHIEQVQAFHFLNGEGAQNNYNAQDGYEFWQVQFGSDDNAQIVNIAQLGFEEAEFFKALNLYIDGQPYQLSDTEQAQIRDGLTILNRPYLPPQSSYLTALPATPHIALSEYHSLQHEMPDVFALTEQVLNGRIDSEKKAQLLQFKGYLQLFDQVLADQHKQLDILPDILSLPQPSLFEVLGKIQDSMLASESLNSEQVQLFWQKALALPHSQLSQALTGLSGIEHLLDTASHAYWQQGMQQTLESDFSIAQLTRLNQSLDHLLARFSERPLDSNLLKYKDVFSFYVASLEDEQDPCPKEPLLERLVLLRQYVDKCRLLTELSELGQNRCRGYDYLASNIQHSQCSSMSKGMMRRLGFSHPAHMPLATHNRESFYLVEGSLLKSSALDTQQNAQLGRSLFFVLPNWTTRFATSEFRQLTEAKLRELAPLHMPVYCMWLDREAMSTFERLYYGWLNYFSQTQKVRFTQPSSSSKAIQQQLSKILGDFFTAPAAAPSSLTWLTLSVWARVRKTWSPVRQEIENELTKQLGEDVAVEVEGESLNEIYSNVDGIIKTVNTDGTAPLSPEVNVNTVLKAAAGEFYLDSENDDAQASWQITTLILARQAKHADSWGEIKALIVDALIKSQKNEPRRRDLVIEGQSVHEIYQSVDEILATFDGGEESPLKEGTSAYSIMRNSAQYYFPDFIESLWPISQIIMTHQGETDGDWGDVKATIVEQLKQYAGGQYDFVVSGNTFNEVYESVLNTIFVNISEDTSLEERGSFPDGFSVDDICYLTAQHYIDEICRPSISDHVDRSKRLTIGYTPLPYLRPLYPLSISTINPSSSEQPKFIVAHSKPNRI